MKPAILSNSPTKDHWQSHFKITENSVRDQIIAYVMKHSYGFAWLNANEIHMAQKYKLTLHPFYRAGVYDVLGSWKHFPLAVEVKRPQTKAQRRGTLSPKQLEFGADALAKGWIAMCCWSLKDFIYQLPELEKYARAFRRDNFLED